MIQAPGIGDLRNIRSPASGPISMTSTMNTFAASVIGTAAAAWAAPWTRVTAKWPRTSAHRIRRAALLVCIRPVTVTRPFHAFQETSEAARM